MSCCRPCPPQGAHPPTCFNGILQLAQCYDWFCTNPTPPPPPPPLNLPPTTNATPTDGDLWYDGTHLNFFHGGTTTAIV